jgi:hypothetical protein
MERTHGPDLLRPHSPASPRSATLQRGLAYERQLVTWCGWMATVLERTAQDSLVDAVSI